MRKTLGWSDERGNPRNPEAHASYKELHEIGGIGRGRVQEAINEAIERRFIDCIRFGQPHRPGEGGFAALYSLRWDEREQYVTDPQDFDGFFAGNGNLTHIPNEFFDYTIPNESLSVVKVIGVVIRNTIGWQTKFGYRRQKVAISYTEIMRKSGIASRSTVSQAIKDAVDGRHVYRVSEGVFDPHNPVTTTYGILWADQAQTADFEPKSLKRPGIEPGGQPRNRTSSRPSAPESNQGNSPGIEPAKRPGIGPARDPESNQQETRNRTSNKTTNINNTLKQQQSDAVVGATDLLTPLGKELVVFGIDKKVSARLVKTFPAERIERQLQWIDRRKADNPQGLLIRCIEADLPEPGAGQDLQTSEPSTAQAFANHFLAELQGNAGEPLGLPSTADEVAAKPLLTRLQRLDVSAEELGRLFARFVLKEDQGSKSKVRTLPLAARLFGNGFVAAQEARQRLKASEPKVGEGAKEKDPLAAEYEAFVHGIAGRLEEGDEELRAQFEAAMEAKIHSRKRMSVRASEMLAKELSTPEGRLRNLIEHLVSTEPDLIPSRPQWEQDLRLDQQASS